MFYLVERSNNNLHANINGNNNSQPKPNFFYKCKNILKTISPSLFVQITDYEYVKISLFNVTFTYFLYHLLLFNLI